MLTTLRWLLGVWKFCGAMVYAMLETMMMVMVMKPKTKWFCNEFHFVRLGNCVVFSVARSHKL